MGKIKVCHLTSVHKQFDIRIFYKELISLTKADFDVYQISQGESGEKEGVNLIGLGDSPNSRLKRILSFTRKVFKAAKQLDADIYQIHDPELLPTALKLSKQDKIVIFDSHENVSGQIEEKTYIPKFLRKIIAYLYEIYEKNAIKRLDGVITVSPNITKVLKQYNQNAITITNYPLLSEKTDTTKNSDKNQFSICFPGLISEEWCHLELLEAIEKIDLKYILCGPVHEEYFADLKKHPSWEKVNYLGIISRDAVIDVIDSSSLGMALARKLPNTFWNEGTLGNTKLFEYMLHKCPVCCTNFDLWKEIIDKYHCGIYVEPDKPEQIKKALIWFMEHPQEAEKMGERGYQAVCENYNWLTQEKKLLDFYENLIANRNIN